MRTVAGDAKRDCTTTILPGSYEDGPDLQRWWDGERWTERTRPFQAEAPADVPRGSRDPKSRRRILWISVGAAVVALVVAVALIVPALLGAADRSRDEQAAVDAVDLYSDAWTDGDCDAYLASTTVRTRESFGSLLDAGGTPVVTPIPVETSFVYVLVPTGDDGWAIDFADVDE